MTAFLACFLVGVFALEATLSALQIRFVRRFLSRLENGENPEQIAPRTTAPNSNLNENNELSHGTSARNDGTDGTNLGNFYNKTSENSASITPNSNLTQTSENSATIPENKNPTPRAATSPNSNLREVPPAAPHSLAESARYELAQQRFALAQNAFFTLVSLAWLFWGFAWLAKLPQTLAWQCAAVVFFIALNWLLGLPFELYSTFKLQARFGLNATTPRTFAADCAKSAAIFAIIAPPLIVAFLLVFASLPPLWWVWASVGCAGLLFAVVALFPLVNSLFFNRLSPLPDAALSAQISRVFAAHGVGLGGVFVADASRRSKKLNAYFAGLGKTRRVVLFDTLVARLSRVQLLAVVGHELGHLAHGDIVRQGVLSCAAVAAIFALVGNLPASVLTAAGLGANAAGVLLFVLLFGGGFLTLVAPIFSLNSRRAEFGADAFGARVASARALASALQTLSGENKSFPYASAAYAWFYHSHPSVPERVARLREMAHECGEFGEFGGDLAGDLGENPSEISPKNLAQNSANSPEISVKDCAENGENQREISPEFSRENPTQPHAKQGAK